jgi:hypothetical protein
MLQVNWGGTGGEYESADKEVKRVTSVKVRDCERLIRKYVLVRWPTYRARGRLAYLPDLNSLLRGYYFDVSGFDKARFTVNVFVQPLYVPFPSIAFTNGGRLGTLRGAQERWWSLDAQNEAVVMSEVCALIDSEGEPFLREIDGPEALLGYLRRAPEPTVRQRQTIAYSLALLGRYADAVVELDRMTSDIQGSVGRPPWMDAMVVEAGALRATLVSDGPRSVDIFRSWRDATLKNVGLLASS